MSSMIIARLLLSECRLVSRGVRRLSRLMRLEYPGRGLFAGGGAGSDGEEDWQGRAGWEGRLFCPGAYDEGVKLMIELDREEDGRWIAETIELPGVMCYEQTRDEAISNAERLAIEVIADRIAHGELPSSSLGVSFTIPDEQLARQ